MSPSPSRGLGLPLAAAAALLGFLAALATAVLAVHASAATKKADQLVATGADESARQQVLAAARQIAVDFSAYDYRHIDQDFKRVADETTGAFHQQYVTQSAGIRDIVVRIKAVSTAEITGAGIVELSPTKATVLVALDRLIKNTSTPDGQHDPLGVQLTLEKRGSTWLASGLTPA